MNVIRFRRLLRAVLLAGGPCATVACSSSNVTEMPERAVCTDVRAATRYSALTLSPQVDGIALATRGMPELAGAPSPSPAATTVPVQRLAALGTPCATAKDRDKCAHRVDELLAASTSVGWNIDVSECGDCVSLRINDVGVITQGDDVRLATLADLVHAAAPAETRDEAAALLVLQGFRLDCDMNNVRKESDGGWTFKDTNSSCSGAIDESFYKVTVTGEVVPAGSHEVAKADNNCTEGRRPANLAATGASWLSSLAACFSEIAYMEAASVIAFDDLGERLRGLGAPAELLERCARAKNDEIAHAAMTTRLANRFGATPKSPRVESASAPAADAGSPLLRLAIENAVEGCVREAYGALVAAYQAANATDRLVRAVFTQIAADEADHAELSFDLDAWLAPQLTADERRLVDAAKAKAWLDLAAACSVEPAAEVIAVAGMPSAANARALLGRLASAACDVAA